MYTGVVARAVIVKTEPHVAVEPGCAVLPLLHMVLVHQAGHLNHLYLLATSNLYLHKQKKF
jgi:hypothetical protein